MDVLVGTYEEFVLGLKLQKQDEKYKLSQTFSDHGQCGSVRCIAVSGKFVACGSSDETIKVYDLQKRIDFGNLIKHNGTVTCVDGFKSENLLSGSEDGTICIWRTRGWECDRTLVNAHKGGVTSLSIHPSGKLALSVGKDKSLRTWNLIKARTAYVKNLHAVGDLVRWSDEGTRYLVVIDSTLTVYSTESADVVYVVKTKGRIHSAVFVQEDILAIGSESPNVELHNLRTGSLLVSFEAHEKRVKALAYAAAEGETFLCTASSDGFVKVWKLQVPFHFLKTRREPWPPEKVSFFNRDGA
ncbi:hypothetical protein QYM36_001968 [Artemia franciscana]|uniref:P21-activated protein kinase-interacting protein 1-like n=1 Tax=Artemia franciscana TaxID=6661 RepID=A0AA88LEG5_ARTSF|nr:hypothetical protein QYM36_001968 [Artemia franciscana]